MLYLCCCCPLLSPPLTVLICLMLVVATSESAATNPGSDAPAPGAANITDEDPAAAGGEYCP